MREIKAILTRNLKKYYRNIGMIFFSLLTAFIVAALYMFFLADMQIENIKNMIGNVEGIDLLVKSWMVGGFVFIPAVSVPQMILCFKVDDIIEGKDKDLYVAPTGRTKILLGYIVSALLIGMLMTIGCFAVGQAYLVAGGGSILSISDMAKSLGILFLVLVAFTGIEIFVISFIKSNAMVSVLNSLLNVFLGFLLGLYVPVGMLGDVAGNVIKSVPLLPAASILRGILMKDSMLLVFRDTPDQLISEARQMYGVDIMINNSILKTEFILTSLVICGIIFYIGAALINRYRKEE